VVARVIKIPVGAHYGLRDWLSQRITALVMALYTVVLLGELMWHGGMDYPTWRALFAGGAFRVLSFLFLACVYYHAWVGMRNILMDYVKPTGVRLVLQALVICALVGYTGWAIQILWGPR
jgi:succinate dehydrogenase / fumarate reductase, membrane anchor subunit